MSKNSIAMEISISLPVTFDHDECMHLKDSFLAALKDKSSVQIDSSELDRMGTLGVQLLLSAAKAFKVENLSFRDDNPSPVLRDTFETLGCTAHAQTYGIF
jgi:chemotaxis protein CheX